MNLYNLAALDAGESYRFSQIRKLACIPERTLRDWRARGWLKVAATCSSMATGASVRYAFDRRYAHDNKSVKVSNQSGGRNITIND